MARPGVLRRVSHPESCDNGGGSFVIDFWLDNSGGTPSDFSVKLGGVTIFTTTDPGSFGYTHFTFNVNTATNITALEFDFLQVPSYFHLDDISVAAAPDSGSTVVLLRAAMIVVGLLRRRIAAKRA